MVPKLFIYIKTFKEDSKMKSVNEVNACNCEQIMVSVQWNGDCTAKKVSSAETKVSITAIETVLSDYVVKKKVEKIAKAIAEVVDTSSNADNVQITLVWKDGTKYCISDDESGKPKLVELKEETSNLKDEIRGIAKDYIDEDEIDEFLGKATEAITTTVKANDTPAYMPEGFKYLDGSIESLDYRIVDEQGNVFTWVSERTLKDGRLVKGFWVSSYEISKGADGTPKSVEGEMPWVNITRTEAVEQAKKFGGRLFDDPEWDAICEEYAETIGEFKVYRDSTDIGNYYNSVGSTQELEKTGKHVICGISNMAGNCWTWTNATIDNKEAVIRGGSCNLSGNDYPMASRYNCYPCDRAQYIGFRIVL